MIISFVSLYIVLKVIKEVGIFKLGYCSNSQVVFLMLRHLSIWPIMRKLISFVSVSWQPPPPRWVEENTDGLVYWVMMVCFGIVGVLFMEALPYLSIMVMLLRRSCGLPYM